MPRKKFNRGKPSFKIEETGGKFWVIESYRTGEFQVHNPMATKEEAEFEMAALTAEGGSFGDAP